MGEQYVLGIDFGTLAGRAIVVRVSDGAELGSAVHEYRHAVMDRTLTAASDQQLPPEFALQVPNDYRDVLQFAVPEAVAAAGIDAADVIGIGTDFTACTMIPVLADGTPLCELDEFADRPHAYAKLWKHHAAQPQATRINELAAARAEWWLPRYGGLISSEWEFAKGLELLECDPEIYHRMDHWVEAGDWIVWQMTGKYVRNACAAGYKGNWQDGKYPSAEFLAELNPDFATFVADKLDHQIGQLGERVGGLDEDAAAVMGLPAGIAVSTGHIDAHVTAPAANAVQPGQMVAIMGTSTCHVVSATDKREVPGMCGVVDGGIVAGLYGYEAGQSGVGDIFGWFVNNCVPVDYEVEASERGITTHELLTLKCADQPVGGHGLIALDWWSGNRSVLVDHELSGLILGMDVTTAPEDIYRALLESTAFGTRMIIEAFIESEVEIKELVVAGGLLKNSFLMQLYSDVTRLPLSTIVSEQGCALGAAIHGAVAAGAYPDVQAAAQVMGKRVENAYLPNEKRAAAYDVLFAEYRQLHDYFGRGSSEVMRRLKQIRRSVRG